MLRIRPLTLADSVFADRLASLYGHLTQYGALTSEQVAFLLNTIHAQWSVILSAWVDDIVVWLTTIMIEHKLIRWWSRVWHIEDVVVDPAYQWQGIGQHLIREAKIYAQTQWCYKVILDCDEKMLWWYRKHDFVYTGVCMRRNCSLDA